MLRNNVEAFCLYTNDQLTDKIPLGQPFCVMNFSKTHFFLLGIAVVSLGIVLGTFLWLRLAPKPQRGVSDAKPLEGLTRHGAVPEFSLTERSGKATGLGELRGKVWIADFIYTTCTDTCPLQTAEMAKLQVQWHDQPELRLVSFSVDPAHDTPQVLSRYADKFKADVDRWLFLTGAKEEITRLIQEGFRLSAAPAPDGAKESGVILHSPRFVLVDKEAQIRGYYDSRDGEALRRLRDDIAILLTKDI
jgi:protein SCO1/2